MRINPTIASSAINRYEKVVRRESAEGQGMSTTDKIELSDKARLYASLIQSAKSSDGDINEAKVHAILNQMASGAYRLDVSRLAEKMTAGLIGGDDNE